MFSSIYSRVLSFYSTYSTMTPIPWFASVFLLVSWSNYGKSQKFSISRLELFSFLSTFTSLSASVYPIKLGLESFPDINTCINNPIQILQHRTTTEYVAEIFHEEKFHLNFSLDGVQISLMGFISISYRLCVLSPHVSWTKELVFILFEYSLRIFTHFW